MLWGLKTYVHDQKGKLLEIVFEQLYCDTSTTESVLSKREISKIYSSLFDTRQTFGNSWYSVSDTHKYQKTTEINFSLQQTSQKFELYLNIRIVKHKTGYGVLHLSV